MASSPSNAAARASAALRIPRGFERQYATALQSGYADAFDWEIPSNAIYVAAKSALHAAARLRKKWGMLKGIDCTYAGTECRVIDDVLPTAHIRPGDTLVFEWRLKLRSKLYTEIVHITGEDALAWTLPSRCHSEEEDEDTDHSGEEDQDADVDAEIFAEDFGDSISSVKLHVFCTMFLS